MASSTADRRELDLYADELRQWEGSLRSVRDLHNLMWKEWMIGLDADKRESSYLSKVKVPYGYHAVETIVPRIVGEDLAINYRPISDDADQLVAAIHSGLAKWQIERMRLPLELRHFTRQGCITGYTVAKVGWTREEADELIVDIVERHDPLLGAMLPHEHEREETVIVRNQPFVETIHVSDFVWPAWARDLEECPAVWQRRWVTLGYLRAMQEAGVYKNIDDVRPTGNEAGRFEQSREAVFSTFNTTATTGALDPQDDRQLVEIWERWTDDHLCVIASPFDSPVKLRADDNPFQHGRKPFIDWAPTPVPMSMHGIGIIQSIYDLNEDLNTLRRQRSDAIAYSINPGWKSLTGNGKVLEMFPGVLYQSDDPANDLLPLVTPDIDLGSAFNEEQILIGDIRNISGAQQYLTGDSPGSQTATEVASAQSEGNRLIAEKIMLLNERTMKPLGMFLMSMNSQFIDDEIAVDFTRDPRAAQAWIEFVNSQREPDEAAIDKMPGGIVKVHPAWLAAKGKLEPLPIIGQDKELSKIQRRSDATQAVQALLPFLGLPTPVVNPKATAQWVLEQYDIPATDIQRMLDTSEQEQQLAMLQQAAAGQPPSSSGPSGPSGDSLPTGAVDGAPGAAGGQGPQGFSGAGA